MAHQTKTTKYREDKNIDMLKKNKQALSK